MLSRLDRMIRRLTAQRACLDWAIGEVLSLPGPVLELGLGMGRSYDHLRVRLPERDIYVFDQFASTLPDCTPPPDRMILGEFHWTLPEAVHRFARTVALVHADIGGHDGAASVRLASDLAPAWTAMLRPGAILVSDQPVAVPNLTEIKLARDWPDYYHVFRRGTE